jgi:tRNA 2-thiocytidine biosynthesis protein TtcA
MNAPQDAAAIKKAAQKREFEANKLSKRLHRQVGQAIGDFNMIEAGDKVMVCLSGGKDSHALLDILLSLRERSPAKFDIVAVNLDQKQPGFPDHVLPQYLRTGWGCRFTSRTRTPTAIVKKLVPEGKTMCSLCSRLRRGILYRVASELGATKIALGHHRDDMVVTLLMNMFFGSRIKGMPPKLVSDDGRNVVIRPLAYVAESDLERWAAHRQFPIIPCSLCGSQTQPAAGAGEGHDPRVGAPVPRPHRQHGHRHGQRDAVAPDGPEPLSLHHAQSHRPGQRRRRHRL